MARIRRHYKGSVCESPFYKGIYGKFSVSLFKVEPERGLPKHKHPHAHVFYFLRGKGVCWIGTKSFQIKPGDVALIRSEKEHGYLNTGKSDLLLVVLNCPATR